MTQIKTPKSPNLYWDANKVYMIFIQRSAGRSYSSVQQTNNFNQRRKGNLGGQNCSNREHEYIHRPNVVKTCFTCRRYTVKSHAGENQHACYSMAISCLVHCLFLFRHTNTKDDAMLSPFTQYWHCQQLAVQFAPPLFGCVFCVCVCSCFLSFFVWFVCSVAVGTLTAYVGQVQVLVNTVFCNPLSRRGMCLCSN